MRLEREPVPYQAVGSESRMSDVDPTSIQADDGQEVSSVKSGGSSSWGNFVLDVVSLASRGSDANSYDSEFNPVPPGEFNPNPDYLEWCGSDRDSRMSDSGNSWSTDKNSIGSLQHYEPELGSSSILQDYEPESSGSFCSTAARTCPSHLPLA